MPIYFGPTKQEKYIITLGIPSGYTVENLPSSLKINTEDEVFSFLFNSKYETDTIQIGVTIQVNKVLLPTSYYEMLKEFFQRTIEKQNEKIVLKKA